MRYRTLAATIGLTFLTSMSATVLAEAPKSGAPAATRPAASAAELSRSDKDFLDDSLTSGLTVVEASKIIQGKAGDEKLKQLADRMIREQGALNAELAAMLARKGVTPASEPTMLQRTQLKALESLESEEAAKMYAKQFGIALQQNDLYRYQDMSTKADDADIRTFAKNKVSGFQDRINLSRGLGKSDLGH
jgi:putative membrane protein